ncbi:hypothetical protein [Pelosinus fermentans]|uniref:Uncharacterized protein n=1 Tax=Pelosinus fermentans JBW45 TaxID=1192197 RepID=I8TPA7_9FIRM|nr:hypothetical protein [Pelosinus fermentans]AJQ29643.1 hypothetical protein JBW_04312 [Pelosinus fermentans JBW45]
MINHSWDVFDTLIARRCIHPYGIFHIVEQETRMTGFAKARIQSEQCVAARKCETYTIDDIYEEIISSYKVDPSIGARLKELEINTEIEQAIPIVENIKKVKPGDILISDMYLPKDVIKLMLLKVGLNVPFELIVTTNGKASSRIWNDFICQDMQLSHTGDNITTDIAVPGKMGIDVDLTNLARLTPSEDYLLTQNQIEFAQYLRSIRLKNKYSTELEKSYWQLFSSGNLGILLIYLKLIEDFVQSKSYEFVGFCGRDCYTLVEVSNAGTYTQTEVQRMEGRSKYFEGIDNFFEKLKREAASQREYSEKRRQERNQPFGDFLDSLVVIPGGAVIGEGVSMLRSLRGIGKISEGLGNAKYLTRIEGKVKGIKKEDLAEGIAKSFTDGNYRTVVTNENVTLYRTFGGRADAGGLLRQHCEQAIEYKQKLMLHCCQYGEIQECMKL